MIQPDDLGAWWERLFDDRALCPALPQGQRGSGAFRTADCGRMVSQETALEGATLLLHRYSETPRIAFVLVHLSPQGRQAIPLRSRCAPSSRPARWQRSFRRIKDIASRSATINPLGLQHFPAGRLASVTIVLAGTDDEPPSLEMPSMRLFALAGRNLRIEWPDAVTCALPDHLIACLDWLRSDREFATLDILSAGCGDTLAHCDAVSGCRQTHQFCVPTSFLAGVLTRKVDKVTLSQPEGTVTAGGETHVSKARVSVTRPSGEAHRRTISGRSLRFFRGRSGR